MSENQKVQEAATGKLFGELFAAYDDEAFKRSVELFKARFEDAGFDLSWFKGKACLDAGCGGGRYSIAMAHLGAAHVSGIDLGEQGVADARKRALALGADHVDFRVGSVADLPFPDESFDCIIHSGVLQHTADPIGVLRELSRVLRPGGMIYMLVYATEGLRWPLVQMLRPIAQRLGFDVLDRGVSLAGLPVNRRRTYLDDLFVPYIDFYSWPCLDGLLKDFGYSNIERWNKGRLDHEENLESYCHDLKGFFEVFDAVAKLPVGSVSDAEAKLVQQAINICMDVLAYAETVAESVRKGEIADHDGRALAIGQGHHRLVAWKL